ncbi:hypothetical protein E2C01_027277 [Portunus trituberculatus]|uniref:Uncharacterized protein n=1 Tax=Portunus trituberculatus TaxID=210409 RepID=A0A5B7EL82_PORTR|nr:hypothetical protein [Portunus trituberculatus]
MGAASLRAAGASVNSDIYSRDPSQAQFYNIDTSRPLIALHGFIGLSESVCRVRSCPRTPLPVGTPERDFIEQHGGSGLRRETKAPSHRGGASHQ